MREAKKKLKITTRFEVDRVISIQSGIIVVVVADQTAAEIFQSRGHSIWLGSAGDIVFRNSKDFSKRKTLKTPTGGARAHARTCSDESREQLRGQEEDDVAVLRSTLQGEESMEVDDPDVKVESPESSEEAMEGEVNPVRPDPTCRSWIRLWSQVWTARAAQRGAGIEAGARHLRPHWHQEPVNQGS